MRYQLGYMDKYPIEVNGTSMENDPMYRVVLKEPVDPDRLERAVKNALTVFPLFASKVMFDKEYYLRTNHQPLVILNCAEDSRPKTFGKNTNGYPWRIIYHDRKVCFEWMHGVTDGMGALEFFKQVVQCYFGLNPDTDSAHFPLEPGLEPFEDKKERGDGYKIDPEGFSFSNFPLKYNDYRTDCHNMYTDSAELVSLAHQTNSSVASVLAVIYSKAIRMHLPANIKNRRVACNIVLDLRRPLNFKTMHNCVDFKRITYLDEYDSMSFAEVAGIYKNILDRARLKKNVIRAINDRLTTFRLYHIFPSKRWLKFVCRIIAKLFKNSDCNFVLSYPGKIDLPVEVCQQIEDFDFKLWHDVGQSIMGALDYQGRFNLNLSENFADKGVVADFIKLSRELGIHWTETSCAVFEQAHFDDAGL